MTEARVRPDAPWLLYVVTVAVFALYVFGAIVSFSGLYGIASWLILPPMLYWSFPLAVDLAIIVYKVAEVILKQDARKVHKVKKAVFGSLVFTAVSSIGNVIHVANANDPDPLKFWGGVFFVGLMPWGVYLAASVLTDLIVKPLRIEREEPAQGGVADAELRDMVEGEPQNGYDTAKERLEQVFQEHENEYPVDQVVRLRTQEMFKPDFDERPFVKVPDEVPNFSVRRDIKPFPTGWGGDATD